MSQTDYARRRQCVPPPSVKGRRSVFLRRIAGEAVFFTVFKTEPEKNTSTKTSAPFTIAYELPRNSRVGVDCQCCLVWCCVVWPAIRAWVWIASDIEYSRRLCL